MNQQKVMSVPIRNVLRLGCHSKVFSHSLYFNLIVTAFSNWKRRYINEFTYLLFQNENNGRMDNNVRFNKWSRFKFSFFNAI